MVDDVPEGAEEGYCASQSCDFEHEPEFQVSTFADASVCPPEACPVMPLQGLVSGASAQSVHLSYAAETLTELTLSRVSLSNVVLELSVEFVCAS